MESIPDESQRTEATNGLYSFTGLNPAEPKQNAATYDANGNVIYTSLKGGARATYRLEVSVPDGYRLTKHYYGGSAPTVENRKGDDSDFVAKDAGGTTGSTVRFYIPAIGGMDDTYDAGVIRERDLTIAKKGTNGLPVEGAEFAIYGPYYNVMPSKISADEHVDDITTDATGKATFTSSDTTCLNAYAYYVVVETKTPEHYDAADLTATGGSVVSGTKPIVTGEGIVNGNYFVLKPFDGEGMTGAVSDEVEVTNAYAAQGELTIQGQKTLTGAALEENDFSFTLTSTDDEDFKAGQTVRNDANGSFAFTPIVYDYADVQYLASEAAAEHGNAYHYTVVEVNENKPDIVYDETVYEIEVTLADEGYGRIGVSAVVNGTASGGSVSVTFTNEAEGQLTITKNLESNVAGDAGRSFDFEITLVNGAAAVDGTYTTTVTENGKTTPGADLVIENGAGSFSLTGGQTLAIGGIPAGTTYTVTEKDYKADGFVTTSEGASGTIAAGVPAEAVFTNAREVGELTIAKTVAGSGGDTDKAFAFTLELISGGNDIDVDGVYDATLYTVGAASQDKTITVEGGKAEFTLTHDQRLVIHEIPAGTAYEVSEASYALDGYQTEGTGATGVIPATGAMPVASFINTRDVGTLRIGKAFAGNAPIRGDTFAFTIRLSRGDGVNVDGVYAAMLNGAPTRVTFTGGAATVNLTGDDVLEIPGILSGTSYAVSEEIPDGSGYLGTSENETGVIPVDAVAVTTFTNARNTGILTVRKAVAGNAAETDRSFSFTVFLRQPDGTNANGTYTMTGIAGSSITFVNGYASLSLAAGEEAVIHGILDGAYYSVTENDANTDGYVTTSSATAGVISAASDALVSFLNTRNLVEEFTSRTVRKIWDDQDDADGLRPDELIVYLLADGSTVAAAALNEANGWSTVFADLPVYNADGTQIIYEVVEAYTAEYYVRYQYEASVISITKTHIPDSFTPRPPDDPALLTLIEDNPIPLGGNVNMNEGDCFN